ncbi:biliverdin-producing heme oxygenase [Flavihumibacter sp. CACIAM 22H1]|uniref:biliverdin-producing heme oxygenase n=1 Tax=Flavihumibacter sp. CACIAM 22H1 TaxID=1812911 RepID=UPI0007A7E72F|nr:biliverdin-producing heme oxygenase [Flavihumibacter sp. CACIAM 22H1]KYP15737.1 MAG: hypothetical protein A1D16_05185 [Flavihumibacter sp. CACIAM 22H1]
MLHPFLRSKTDDQHQQLEKVFLDLLQGVKTQVEYEILLKKMAGFLVPLEKQLTQFPLQHIVPDIAERQRMHHLLTDIAVFDPDWQPLNSVKLPELTSIYQAIGTLYVLEGATLGGPIIARMIKQQAGIEKGLHYFESYGPERKTMWAKFRDYLEIPGLYQHKEIIASSAIACFRAYKQWLELTSSIQYDATSN